MINFNNVSFSYGKKEILKDFSLNITDGEVLCLFAPSGFGKTTVLRLIMGLERVTEGEITGLDGKKISAVFQEDRLLPGKTLLENVKMFDNKGLALDIIVDLGLADAVNLYPNELSGGMARRAAIARALCREADIYILDEPFNGIDYKNIEKTVQTIRTLTEGKTVLLVTHDLEQAEMLGARVIDISKQL